MSLYCLTCRDRESDYCVRCIGLQIAAAVLAEREACLRIVTWIVAADGGTMRRSIYEQIRERDCPECMWNDPPNHAPDCSQAQEQACRCYTLGVEEGGWGRDNRDCPVHRGEP